MDCCSCSLFRKLLEGGGTNPLRSVFELHGNVCQSSIPTRSLTSKNVGALLCTLISVPFCRKLHKQETTCWLDASDNLNRQQPINLQQTTVCKFELERSIISGKSFVVGGFMGKILSSSANSWNKLVAKMITEHNHEWASIPTQRMWKSIWQTTAVHSCLFQIIFNR